jgi:hypothetical protein
VILVRYADDIVVGFQYKSDAEAFRDAMRECETAWGLDADRRRKALIRLWSEGSCCRAD